MIPARGDIRRRLRYPGRRGPGTFYRRAKSVQFLFTRDRRAVVGFLRDSTVGLSTAARLSLVREFVRITNAVRGYHTLGEMLTITREVLRRRDRTGLTVVEAGCAHGASTAKLGLAVRAAGGRLIACDSFRGIPPNDERHRSLDGRELVFRPGAFRATVGAVRRRVERYGAPEVTRLLKGPFAETLPQLEGPLDVVILDVDLLESTRTCIRELFPRLRDDGVLISLDGQLEATHQLLQSASFWQEEVGVPLPDIEGLGTSKLLRVRPAG